MNHEARPLNLHRMRMVLRDLPSLSSFFSFEGTEAEVQGLKLISCSWAQSPVLGVDLAASPRDAALGPSLHCRELHP